MNIHILFKVDLLDPQVDEEDGTNPILIPLLSIFR